MSDSHQTILRSLTVSVVVVALWAGPAWGDPYVAVSTHPLAVVTQGDTYLETQEGNANAIVSPTGPLTKDSGLLSTGATHGCSSSARATAWADYGSLGVGAWATGSSAAGYDAFGYSDATTQFYDIWTINGPGHNGQTGTVSFQVHVEGMIIGMYYVSGVSPGSRWSLAFDNWTSTVGSWDYYANQPCQGGDFNFTKSFVFGQPFGFDFHLIVSAMGFQGNSPGAALYESTASITGYAVADSAGAAVNTFTTTTGSGHVYPVPEPASAVLLAALIGLCATRRI
jgi:hypothetical protein